MDSWKSEHDALIRNACLSDTTVSKQARNVNSVLRAPSRAAPTDISLFELVRNVWRRRLLVAGITGLCGLVGIGYAHLITPIYEASTILRPVAMNELDALNRSEIYSLPPVAALKRVGAMLDSYNARWEFFRSRPDLIDVFQAEGQSLEQAFEEFNKSALTLVQPDPKKTDLLSAFIGLNMRFKQGVKGASILNDFVDFSVERERVQLSSDLKLIQGNRLAEIDAKLSSAISEYQVGKESRIARLEESDKIKRAELYDELKALRVQLKMRRDARISQLDEAIVIARGLGLKKPSTPSLMADEAAGVNIIRTEVNSPQAPLYFLGTDVLEAERNALRKRTNDDFVEPRIAQIRKELIMLSSNRKVEVLRARGNEMAFLEGIEALRVERARLQSIDTNLNGLHLVNIDQRAIESTKPVNLRKGFIITVALVVGLLLGALIALLRSAFKDHLRRARVVELEFTSQRLSVD